MPVLEAEARPLISDRKRFIESLFQIQNKDKFVVPFRLNRVQQRFYAERAHRNIIVKPRQVGLSSFILADMLAEAICVPNSICVCISHEHTATKRLFSRLLFMYQMLPPDYKPEAGHESATELTFPTLGSRIFIGTARAPAFGRGDMVSRLHLSEPAYYPQDTGEKLLAAVTQSVPMNETTVIDYESTPNGRSGLFYELYKAGKEGEGPKPFFFPWWWDSGYCLPEGSPFSLESSRFQFEPNAEELLLIAAENLTLDQIRWRRAKVHELTLLHKDFRQEYPENDIDCWVTGASSVFDTGALREMLKDVRSPLTTYKHTAIWKKANPASKYVIGVDPALGLATSDWSVAVVLDTRTCEHVATLRAKIPLDVFAAEIAEIGGQYNNAWVVVERGGHAPSIFSTLERLDYGHIYRADDKRHGWPTSMRTRSPMIDELSFVIANRQVVTYDKDFIEEAMDFQFIDEKAQAPQGGHDDILFAMMVGLMVRNRTSLTTLRRGARTESYGPEFL